MISPTVADLGEIPLEFICELLSLSEVCHLARSGSSYLRSSVLQFLQRRDKSTDNTLKSSATTAMERLLRFQQAASYVNEVEAQWKPRWPTDGECRDCKYHNVDLSMLRGDVACEYFLRIRWNVNFHNDDYWEGFVPQLLESPVRSCLDRMEELDTGWFPEGYTELQELNENFLSLATSCLYLDLKNTPFQNMVAGVHRGVVRNIVLLDKTTGSVLEPSITLIGMRKTCKKGPRCGLLFQSRHIDRVEGGPGSDASWLLLDDQYVHHHRADHEYVAPMILVHGYDSTTIRTCSLLVSYMDS